MTEYLEKVSHVRYWQKRESLMMENWLESLLRKSQGKEEWRVWDKAELCSRIQAQRNRIKKSTYTENSCDRKIAKKNAE